MNPTITMAEALAVRAAIKRLIHQLEQERITNSVAVIDKGETAEYPARTVDIITAELERAMRDYRQLDLRMAIANTVNVIQWDGGTITVMEAIELAKQMRSEIEQLRVLGGRKKMERQYAGGYGERSNHLFSVALYDPDAYLTLARKKEREATKLSSLIEHSNHMCVIEFDSSPYMD